MTGKKSSKLAHEAGELQRRLAAVESLCRYSRAAVQLKMGDSSKLARADDDLTAAIEALTEVRASLKPDAVAEAIAASGEAAEASYLHCAKWTPRPAE